MQILNSYYKTTNYILNIIDDDVENSENQDQELFGCKKNLRFTTEDKVHLNNIFK